MHGHNETRRDPRACRHVGCATRRVLTLLCPVPRAGYITKLQRSAGAAAAASTPYGHSPPPVPSPLDRGAQPPGSQPPSLSAALAFPAHGDGEPHAPGASAAAALSPTGGPRLDESSEFRMSSRVDPNMGGAWEAREAPRSPVGSPVGSPLAALGRWSSTAQALADGSGDDFAASAFAKEVRSRRCRAALLELIG